MAERIIDEFQMKAIKAENNSVVSAGAGSGKTTVLSERFSNLVIEKHYKVQEILTLTFTKKATVEMSSRIYNVLKQKAPEEATDFYKANIKTLDGYCNSVAKLGCHFYGISPDFTENQSALEDQVKNLALPFILQHRDNFAIKALVNTKNYEQTAYELFVNPVMRYSTVCEPIDFDSALKNQVTEIVTRWNAEGKKLCESLDQLRSAFDDFTGGTKSKGYQTVSSILADEFPDFPDMSEADVYNSNTAPFEDYLCCMQKKFDIRLPTGKDMEELKEILSEVRNYFPKNAKDTTKHLIPVFNYLNGFIYTKELLPLQKEFQQKVINLKRTSGMLTFTDISSLAKTILLEHPEIRRIEKEKYKAIMIDEFQDNNSLQRDMLFLLAENISRNEKTVPAVEELCPDKLFFVGDEKQSIYSFRGADVTVFRSLSKDFLNGNLSMTTNYRSHPSLIASFNTFFGGMAFPPSENEPSKKIHTSAFFTETDEENAIREHSSIPLYEPVYHQVTLSKSAETEVEKDPESFYKPHVHFALYPSETEAAPDALTGSEAETEWIARKILELTESGKYKPSDIAILFRKSKNQALIERTLLSHNIPYDSEAVTGFFADGPINDLYSWLRICVYKEDTLSYAKVLCSPFVNLTETQANAILIESARPFEADGNCLEGQNLESYRNAAEAYRQFMDETEKLSLTQLITKLWYENGYRYETIWNKKVEIYSRNYDILFELARNAELDNMSLADFTDSLQKYESDSKKNPEMRVLYEAAEGVHLMTIHKSKGLEFPVVFICNTESQEIAEKNSEIVYASREYGITLNTPPSKKFSSNKSNYFFNRIKHQVDAESTAELRRFAYVALTRAVTELYITNAKYKMNEDAINQYAPENECKPKSLFHVLEPVLNHYLLDENKDNPPFTVDYITPFPRYEAAQSAGRKNTRKEKLSLLSYIQENHFYEKTDVKEKEIPFQKYASPSHLHSDDDETSTPAEYNFDSSAPFQEINEIIKSTIPVDKNSQRLQKARFDFADFGTIAHACMEAAVKGEDFIPSGKDLSALEADSFKIETVLNACRKMKEAFLSTDLGNAALSSDWKKCEYRFKFYTGGKILKGSIDLVFKAADGKYIIVDYKTNQTVEPEIYYPQLSCYRNAVAAMTGTDENNIECWLYYLRFGQPVNITEECKRINITDWLKII